MKILKLELRGAIGILKGIGREEIAIDFSIFDNGLIALVGENGRGKTTIIENLHPFRRLISREGNLADHFVLKDSYRKLEFELGGRIYNSEIYIDGITKKMEAYLRCEGVALNEGKPTSYDSIVEQLLGSEDLFLNSVFSAQKSKGIANLSANQRRELFYELLRLNQYDSYCQNARSKVRSIDTERSLKKGEINLLESQLEKIVTIEDDYNRELTVREVRSNALASQDEKILECRSKIEEMNKEQILLNEKINRQLELRTNIARLNENLHAVENNIQTRLMELMEEKNESIKRENLHLGTSVFLEEERLRIENDLRQLNNENQRAIIKSEIDRIESENIHLKEEIKLLSEYSSQEDEVDRLILSRDTLREESVELTESELSLSSDLTRLHEEEKSEVNMILPIHQEIQIIKNDLVELNSQFAIATSNKDRFVDSYNEKLESVSLEIKTIESVPCEEAVGKNCPFLENAFKHKESIGIIKNEYEEKLSVFDQMLTKISSDIDARKKLMTGRTNELQKLEQALTSKYQRLYGQIQAKQDRLFISKKSKFTELEILESSKLDSRKKKIGEYKILASSSRVKLENNEKMISLKNELLDEISLKEKANIETLKSKLNDIINQIENLEAQKISAIESLKNQYAQNEIALRNEGMLRCDQLNKLITEAQHKLDPALENQIIMIKENLKKQDNFIQSLLTDRESIHESLVECQGKILLYSEELKRKSEIEKSLVNSRLVLKQLEKDHSDYYFLERAFDKTGIPVLKLENTGYEITSLANDLLKYFDNDFRIVFETMRPTKDKKKMKEVFDINVLDSDGICELKNKSGGERVWIETSIQLAIGIVLRHQGKNLQTSFLDEQDGSLDLQNAFNYRQMIENAHRRANVHNTIIITHRQELVELIPQRILLDEDGIKLFLN